MPQARSKVISGVLLVFTFLQFIISICVSAFACKATCCEPTVPVITYTNQAVTSNPQHVVYIQQAPANTINPVPQNMINWPSRKETEAYSRGREGEREKEREKERQTALLKAQKIRLCGVNMASAQVPLTNIQSPLTNVGSGYTIITQVVPASTVLNTAGQISTQIRNPLQKFLKGEPKALGTVQIMIGLLTILFGIVLAVYPQSISIYSGVVFWGSVFHIIAGSLAVAASNKLNSCLLKGAMVLNIFSTLSAGTGIIIFSVDVALGRIYSDCYWDNHNYRCNYSYVAESYTRGMNGVLLVFCLLQFCISISVSAFVCKATCTHEPTLNIINVVPNPETFAPSAPVVSAFPPHHTQLEVNPMHAAAMGASPMENPPAYSEKSQLGQ
ncbi:hypothetical protein KOW79_010427 [Hemibagrus wyckioides]|uniref:Membrane-spanning 4-domains subfamily A member 4A-like n=1 Tax=Hemibagrus wyckioides TaxID=337641 RepID=A0A9D3NP34_9TELE|nr:hypothetical protein KOW79_010427 [Hemibagrus wyckioides]